MLFSSRYFALFPGQGSQKVGMGRSLFENTDIGRELFQSADMALGLPLSQICFSGPDDRLTATDIAQPAILTVSTILYKLAAAQPGFVPPVAAAGHSLGEYSAHVAAGSISFEDAVSLVHKRGRYMQEAVPAGVGTMYAVLGKEIEEIESALSQVKDGVAEIANINAPGQIIVAGDKIGLDLFRETLGKAKLIELQVSAPFHCSLMKPAEDKLKLDLKALSIRRPSFPIYCNHRAEAVTQPEEIREALRLQVCGRVRWLESMQRIIVDFSDTQAIEFGYGAVLTGLLKKISPNVSRHNIDSQESIFPC